MRTSSPPSEVHIGHEDGLRVVRIITSEGACVSLLKADDAAAFARERVRRRDLYEALVAAADRRVGEPIRAELAARAGRQLELGILKAVAMAVKASADAELALLIAIETGAEEGAAGPAMRAAAGYSELAAAAFKRMYDAADSVRPGVV
jgi:hypothetical protein